MSAMSEFPWEGKFCTREGDDCISLIQWELLPDSEGESNAKICKLLA